MSGHEDMAHASRACKRNLNAYSPHGEATPNRTGWFEVSIIGGPLLHSKKRGDGFVDKPEKLKKIVDWIKDALASKDASQDAA
ncbi:Selenoprotein W [Orchesella cincta]|uniref:Selenoprotein W n=1 Tax=Orchesella cincta TaxID=48709 RepID=A0A1D2NA61_ORCCI|nr:Selenoprotein W [Orchesella cincta]